MAKQLLFYETPAAVNPARHGKTLVKDTGDFSFAAGVNSVPIAAAEFALCAAEYPIVFAGDPKAPVPSVILGLDGSRNAFIGKKGNWLGSYVPAYIRRYPFVLSQQDKTGTQTLHIDDSAACLATKGKGEALFDAGGKPTPYLEGVLKFQQDYQAQHQRTQAYAQRLADLELLKPMQANYTTPSGEKRTLQGFFTVDREKLKGLEDDAALQMFRNDELECTFLHLASARNFKALADRVSEAAKAA
ncbi:SapC family protein [Vannielia litorea]|uniref:SapC family protein n=1 Tax=Vannielia litorea TaxID=1217970 RepID=UPI001C944B71|nr:SapC family protein [Vannielia litorea]MBY6048807.1 SapC family protein [Vannielia litorea]MBY6076221.1 SapC family protein [Vannielia litorea]